MKSVPISGSKFIISLEEEENKWWLRLIIHSAVEEEVLLTHLEKKNIKRSIVELLELGHIQLNDLQIEMIQNEFWNFIEEEMNTKKKKVKTFGTIEDPRYENLSKRIEELDKNISNLDTKISLIEKDFN